ncbi:DinB family protein [Lacinutrix jangbogonensis]|uniref:hypothetical protein n=1 Tax=Lacinutrix jangbogonensis TaxID=1469557 RepID=UPI000AD2584D|nr:hypothetical protein [Lacinutrix jangbogonensis]
MINQELESLKYPIGKFEYLAQISEAHIQEWISVLEAFPNRLETLVKNINNQARYTLQTRRLAYKTSCTPY